MYTSEVKIPKCLINMSDAPERSQGAKSRTHDFGVLNQLIFAFGCLLYKDSSRETGSQSGLVLAERGEPEILQILQLPGAHQ